MYCLNCGKEINSRKNIVIINVNEIININNGFSVGKTEKKMV